MKNLYSKNEFLTRITDDEMINEGLFNFLGKMYNKAKGYINKIKGGKEIQKIYDEYLLLIQTEFKKRAQVNLQLTAEKQLSPNKSVESETKPAEEKKPEVKTKKGVGDPTLTDNYSYDNLDNLNEAAPGEVVDEVDTDQEAIKKEQDKKLAKDEKNVNVKLTAKGLAAKKKVLDEILKLYQTKALRQMNNVLLRMGGKEKNPKLAIIIDNKKDEFLLAFYNAQIKALEQGGDKVAANKLSAERNKLAKNLDARWNLDSEKSTNLEINGQTYKTGTPYRYNKDGEIKTIQLLKTSKNPSQVVAAYTYGETKGQEQLFKVDNIEKDFNPVKDETYQYFSTNKNAPINVKLLEDPIDGMVRVQGKGEPFKINIGALLGKVEKTK